MSSKFTVPKDMKLEKRMRFVVTSLLLAMAITTQAQLTVDVTMPPTQMVQNLVGPGVEISNVVVTAAPNSYGYYQSNGTEIGTSQGLLLTTGKAVYAIGPNNQIGTCSSSGLPGFIPCSFFDNGFPGSPLLNAAQDRVTFDACMFEFDIKPQGDSLKFKYTFASEEYLEWVNSPFKDVFGFYISGPNVGVDVNLALIPNTNQIVSIPNVNLTNNPQYFYNNQNPYGQFIQYDGFTIGLEARVGNLIPCETYHLKLVIADGQDRVYDSGVFINSIESNPVVVLTATSNGLDYMVEGCNDGTITFSRAQASNSPQEVTYWVGGTATNGVDYTPTLGTGVPLEPTTITIPAGQQSVSIQISAVADGLDEGQEYLTVYLGNPLCTQTTLLDSINFFIYDVIQVDIQPDFAAICAGQCVDLAATTGAQQLGSFQWSGGTVSDPNSLNVSVCPTETTTYTLTATVGQCSASDQVTVNVSSISVSLSPLNVNCSNGNTGSITTTVSNALAPFTYSWTGPNGYTSDEADPINLAPGEYCVTVNDASGCLATACTTLIQADVLAITAQLSNFVCNAISCAGACDGAINLSVTGGVAPFTFEWTGPDFTSGIEDISNLCAGTYQVTVRDIAGCQVSNSYTLSEPSPVVIEVVGTVDLLCTGVETGQATVSSSGGCPPYTYSWSHNPSLTGPVALNLGSGEYSVSVTDQNGCTSGGSVTIFINDPIDPLTVVVDEISLYPGGFNTSCPATADGFVNITISGGSPDYAVQWRRLSDNTIVSTSQNLTDAQCGAYQLSVTDANGCQYTQNITLTCVPAIGIQRTVTSNPCGAPEAGIGAIDITSTFGGHGEPYTYEWNGPSCSPCTTEDISNLNSGDYTLVVTDALGCSTVLTVNVGQNDLFSASGSVTNLTCFNSCDGAIDVTIDPPGSYNFAWSGPGVNGASTEDLQNLCAGTYSLTISAQDCQETFVFEVTQPVEIVIEQTEIINPFCFGQNNGSIDITVLNGSGDYSYNWQSNNACFFFGSSSQDIGNLFECDYTVVVTDNVSNCTATSTITLVAPQVMQIIIEPSQFAGGYNTSCADVNDGQLQVFIVGGTPDCNQFAPYCYQFDWTIACSTVDPADYGNDPNADFINNLPGGTYGINVTDANGCLATTCVDMIPPPPIVSAAIIDPIECSETVGSITPNVSGGSNSYASYTWTGNIGSNQPNATTLTNLSAGTYTLTVVDFNGCSETFTYEITQTFAPVITQVSSVDASCANICNGSYSFNISEGTQPYTITINGEPVVINSFPASFNNQCTGSYLVEVVDANNCSASLTIAVNGPPAINIDITALTQQENQIFDLQCFGDSNGSLIATVTGGSGTLTYTWTDGFNNVIGSTPTINFLSAGTYCLTVTDAQGCSEQECYTLTQPATPIEATSVLSLYPNGFNVTCPNANDGSIDVTVTGGVGPYTYSWAGAGVVADSEDQTGLGTGIYDLVVTDANFCTLSLQFVLTGPQAIQVGATLSQFNGGFNTSCNGQCNGSINLNVLGGTPGYTFVWNGPNGYSSTSEDISNLCAGTYFVTITDAQLCSTSQTYAIVQPEVLQASIASNINCSTGAIDLCASATGGSGTYTYEWDNGSSAFCIIQTQSGQRCVTVTDNNGCTNTVCAVNNVYPPLVFNGSSVNASCGQCNGSITISVSGGLQPYDIVWTGNGVIQGALNQTELCEGNYTVSVTDQTGCNSFASITISQNSPIQLQVNTTNVACFGGNTGSATVGAFGATEPVIYLWLDSDGNQIGEGPSITGLAAGSYAVQWLDDAGCTDTQSGIIITQASVLDIDFVISDYQGVNISVPNGNDGFIQVTATGGTPAYTYQWSPINVADTTTRPTGLQAGVYNLTLTDANGCKLDTTFTLIAPEELMLPTGISPNGDGYNDFYVIPGVLRCPKNKFKVFNRWGNLVYEKENYGNEWYGQNKNGETLADGTYFVIFEGCSKEFNSYVDLRRE